jgi:energy-coupling factor transport system substrate-specific component
MSSNRRIALMGLMTAASVSAGYLLAAIPNVEGLSFLLVVSGFLLGFRDGAMTGAASGLIYTVLNPYGPAHPAVAVAQVAACAALGAAGALLRAPVLWSAGRYAMGAFLLVLGIVLTGVYDVATNVAYGLVIGQVRATLALGIPFLLTHVVSNAIIFVVIGVPLLEMLRRRPVEAA